MEAFGFLHRRLLTRDRVCLGASFAPLRRVWAAIISNDGTDGTPL
jgi:hypothetical protein